MAQIKIEIPKESKDHAEWTKKIKAIESVAPDDRSDEQWDELSNLYENEPEMGEEKRTFYIPALASIPATQLKKLPKGLYTAAKEKDPTASFDVMIELLCRYMPRTVVESMTMEQLIQVGNLVKGEDSGES